MNHDVQSARDKRNIDLENRLFERLNKDLERRDTEINDLREKYIECESQHKEALEEINKLKRGRIERDSQISIIEKKVSTLQEVTGTFPKLED